MSPHWCRVIDQRSLMCSLPIPPENCRPLPPVPGGKMYFIITPVETIASRLIKLTKAIMKFNVLRFTVIPFKVRALSGAAYYQVWVAVYSTVCVESGASLTSNLAVRASRFSYLCVDLSMVQLR